MKRLFSVVILILTYGTSLLSQVNYNDFSNSAYLIGNFSQTNRFFQSYISERYYTQVNYSPTYIYQQDQYNSILALAKLIEMKQEEINKIKAQKDELQKLLYSTRLNDMDLHLYKSIRMYQEALDYFESKGQWAAYGPAMRTIKTSLDKDIFDFEMRVKGGENSKDIIKSTILNRLENTYRLAKKAMESKNFESAITLITSIFSEFYPVEDLGSLLTECYLQTKQYDKALPLFEALFSQLKDIESGEKLADLYVTMNSYSKAARVFEELTTLNPKQEDPKYYFLLGWCLTKSGQFEEALKIYNGLIDNKIRRVEALFCKASVLVNMKQFDEAVNTYKALRKIDSQDVQVLIGLISVYIDKNDLKEAKKIDRLILSTSAYCSTCLYMHGMVLMMDKKNKAAAKAFEESLLISETGIAHYMHGIAMKQLGNKTAACISFKKAQILGENCETLIREVCDN